MIKNEDIKFPTWNECLNNAQDKKMMVLGRDMVCKYIDDFDFIPKDTIVVASLLYNCNIFKQSPHVVGYTDKLLEFHRETIIKVNAHKRENRLTLDEILSVESGYRSDINIEFTKIAHTAISKFTFDRTKHGITRDIKIPEAYFKVTIKANHLKFKDVVDIHVSGVTIKLEGREAQFVIDELLVVRNSKEIVMCEEKVDMVHNWWVKENGNIPIINISRTFHSYLMKKAKERDTYK